MDLDEYGNCPPCEICGRPESPRSPLGFILGWCGGLTMGIILCIAVNRYWPWSP